MGAKLPFAMRKSIRCAKHMLDWFRHQWRYRLMSNEPIAETAHGTVRGTRYGDVCVFKGIPYGSSVSAAYRFQPAREPDSWDGIRDAVSYGPMAVQFVPPGGPEVSAADDPADNLFIGNQNLFRPMSENCLVLNVWTPSVSDGAQRPVMLWCHGGGFARGVGDAEWHDGTRLARDQDVVVVQLNHRLNVFGFLSLAEFGGPEYAESGNVGILDIVTALQWIRDNIGRFGGDCNNVTLFGQSGGGAKISALLASPIAQGLFHRAIVQSGSIVSAQTQEKASKAAAAVFRALEIDSTDIYGLLQVPSERLLGAYATAVRAGHLFMPVIDGTTLPHHPFDPGAPAASASVPLLVGTTKDENRLELWLTPPGAGKFDEAALRKDLTKFGASDESLNTLLESYRSRRPEASPSDIYFAVKTDACFRANAVLQAERKAAQNAAPVYMYLFAWEEPGGRLGSPHVVDVPFVFDNLDRAPGLSGLRPNPRCLELGKTVSTAWAAFARTGRPAAPGLPHWNPYDLDRRETMIIDHDSQLAADPRREDRLAMAALGSSYPPLGGWVGLAP
ncbi:carboxylesterase/lipase family protein [Lacisediminihabitans sp. FW035]